MDITNYVVNKKLDLTPLLNQVRQQMMYKYQEYYTVESRMRQLVVEIQSAREMYHRGIIDCNTSFKIDI